MAWFIHGTHTHTHTEREIEKDRKRERRNSTQHQIHIPNDRNHNSFFSTVPLWYCTSGLYFEFFHFFFIISSACFVYFCLSFCFSVSIFLHSDKHTYSDKKKRRMLCHEWCVCVCAFLSLDVCVTTCSKEFGMWLMVVDKNFIFGGFLIELGVPYRYVNSATKVSKMTA